MLISLAQRLYEAAYLIIPCAVALGIVLFIFGHKRLLIYSLIAFLLLWCGGLALLGHVAKYLFTGGG